MAATSFSVARAKQHILAIAQKWRPMPGDVRAKCPPETLAAFDHLQETIVAATNLLVEAILTAVACPLI